MDFSSKQFKVAIVISASVVVLALGAFSATLFFGSTEEKDQIQEKADAEADTLYKLISDHQQRKNYDDVIVLAGEFLQRFSEHNLGVNVQYNLAQAYFSQKQFPQALDEFDKLKQLYPNSHFANFADERIDQIQQILGSPLESFLSENDYEESYGRSLRYYQDGSFDKAIGSFSEFVVSFPDAELTGNAFYWMGESYYAKEDFEEALLNFQKVLSDFPESGKYDASELKIEIINRALDKPEVAAPVQPDLQAIYSQIYNMYQKREYDDAIRAFEVYIDQFPNSPYIPNAYYWMGESYYAKSDWADGFYGDSEPLFNSAKKSFNSVIEDFPKSQKASDARKKIELINQIAQYIDARVEYLNGSYETSRRLFDDFLVEHPENKLAPNSLYWIAQAYFDEKKDLLAKSKYEEVIENYPDDPKAIDAKKRLEEIAQRSTDIVQTTDTISTEVFQNQQQTDLDENELFTNGKSSFENGDFSSAISSLTTLVNISPDFSLIDDATYYLAESHFAKKEYETALGYYEVLNQSLVLNPLFTQETIQERIVQIKKQLSQKEILKALSDREFRSALELIDAFVLEFSQDTKLILPFASKKVSINYLELKDYLATIETTDDFLSRFPSASDNEASKAKTYKILATYRLYDTALREYKQTKQKDAKELYKSYKKTHKKLLKEFEDNYPKSPFLDVIEKEEKAIKSAD